MFLATLTAASLHERQVWAAAFVVLAVLALPTAAAQDLRPYKGEVIVTAGGELVSPWVEKRACVTGTDKCKLMIVNPRTREIARLGDQVASRFEATGNGQELRRAESALGRSKRTSATP